MFERDHLVPGALFDWLQKTHFNCHYLYNTFKTILSSVAIILLWPKSVQHSNYNEESGGDTYFCFTHSYSIALVARVLGRGHIGAFDSQHHSIHEILRRLDQRSGWVQTWYYQFSGDILNVCFHLKFNLLVSCSGFKWYHHILLAVHFTWSFILLVSQHGCKL